MAYVIKKRKPRKDGTVTWRLVYEEYRPGEKRKDHYPKKETWASIGVPPTLPIEEAKAAVRQINAIDKASKLELKRVKIQKRLKDESERESTHLPAVWVRGFEDEILLRRFSRNDKKKLEESGMLSHWRAVQRIIRDMNLETSQWYYQPEIIYGQFEKIKASPSYAQKLLRILNHWGHYHAYRTKQAFLPVPPPTGRNKTRIADTYHDNKSSKESEPISPAELRAAKDRLQRSHYNWLFVALWFGLRPREVDLLREPSAYWEVTKSGKYTVLRIYQPKLTSLEKSKRWKMIPVLFPEQKEALKIVETGDLRRPLPKTIRKNVKDGANCYGPRKGFVDLMLANNYSLESISSWMGHTSIDRTWRSYKDKLALVVVKKAG